MDQGKPHTARHFDVRTGQPVDCATDRDRVLPSQAWHCHCGYTALAVSTEATREAAIEHHVYAHPEAT